MDQNTMVELKEGIKSELEAEVVYLNERQEAFDKINKAYQSLSGKNVALLIDKCNYRMGSLVNAHKYSSVANQEDIEKDTAELNQLVSDLNNEILDIENIGIEMGNSFDETKYQDFANRISSIIDMTLNSCNETVRKATDVLSHKFDSVEMSNVVETPVEEEKEEVKSEEVVDEFTPTEIKTDSIEDIENELNNELQPIKDDKKELESIKNDLEGAEKVTSIEPAPSAIVAPVLMPEKNVDINSFLNQEAQVESKEVESAPIQNEIESAANVDEGPVLVTNVETFGLNEEREPEGPVLARTA